MNEQPKRLGKYEIIEEIGRGANAVVYKARHVELDHIRALKVMHPHLLWEPGPVRRFQGEARAMARLDHANIVIVYDVGEAEGRHYIAMKHLPGRDLKQIIEDQGPLPVEKSLAIIKQVASALDYAHDRDYIHRDIKPSNIIVDDEGRATVTDFGLVVAIGGSRVTATGEMVGTWAYVPPEVFKGEEVDRRGDVYALGVVLYEMLLGRTPFEGGTPEELITKHLMEGPSFPSEMPAGMSEDVKEVLLKALAKDPRERYDTAGEMAEALAQAVGEMDEERRRQARLAELHSQAHQALEEERCEEAMALCNEVQLLQPDYRDVQALQARAESELERKATLQALEDEATKLVGEKKYDEASSVLERICALEARRKGLAIHEDESRIPPGWAPLTPSLVTGSMLLLLGGWLLQWTASYLVGYYYGTALEIMNLSALLALGFWQAGFLLLVFRPVRGRFRRIDLSVIVGAACTFIGVTLLLTDAAIMARVYYGADALVFNLSAALGVILSLVGSYALAAQATRTRPGASSATPPPLGS